MQTIITCGIKFSYPELEEYFKLKNITWDNDYECDFDFLLEELPKVFTDIPEEKYHTDDDVILGFNISTKTHDSNNTELVELGNLLIEPCVTNKLDMFLKNNNLKKEKIFFFSCIF
jgi:hypothetical protein